METIKETPIRGDMSPAISPEARRRHDLEAEKTNYRIALSELSLYIDHSTLHAASDRGAAKDHTWTDHRGQVWVTENPISPAARNTLEMSLKEIRGYEGKYGERGREEQALNDITNARAAGREQSPDRLAHFEKQVTQPDPAKAITGIKAERVPGHGIEIER